MGKDKLLHFVAGFSVALVFSALFGPVIGTCAGVSAGILKEIYDEIAYGGADFWDMAATVAGALAASA